MIIQLQIFFTAIMALVVVLLLLLIERETDIEYPEWFNALQGFTIVVSVVVMIGSFLSWVWI